VQGIVSAMLSADRTQAFAGRRIFGSEAIGPGWWEDGGRYMVAVERSWMPAAGRTEAVLRPAVGMVAAAAMGAKQSTRTPSETRMSTRRGLEAFGDFLSCKGHPLGGLNFLRPFYQKSLCITKLTLGPCVVQF